MPDSRLLATMAIIAAARGVSSGNATRGVGGAKCTGDAISDDVPSFRYAAPPFGPSGRDTRFGRSVLSLLRRYMGAPEGDAASTRAHYRRARRLSGDPEYFQNYDAIQRRLASVRFEKGYATAPVYRPTPPRAPSLYFLADQYSEEGR